MSYNKLLPQLIQKSLVFPHKLKSIAYPFLHGYDQNIMCEFHEGSLRHITKDCKNFKHKVKELIDNEVLMFRRNTSRVNILINKPCSAQGKGSLMLVVIPYPNILKTNCLVLNNLVISSGKAGVESLNKGNNSKYDRGKSSTVYPHVMLVIPTFLKIPYQQGRLTIPAQSYGNQDRIYPQGRLEI